MTSTYKPQLYFIGIVPPEPIYSEIKEFQNHFATTYNAKEALKHPTHITLIIPFQISSEHDERLQLYLKSLASKHQKFEAAIDGFSSFTAGVVYAAFAPNEFLKKIHKELSQNFYKKFALTDQRGPSHAFVPHITLAFKDLSPTVFNSAKAEFDKKIYRRKWMVSDIALFRHTGKEWIVQSRFPLGTAMENELQFLF
ncbi:MAG: 2'-5' RNA ligase family protein [bacterium]